MPRYFFDVHDIRGIHRDDHGHDLPDLEAVRKEAMRTLPEIAYDQMPSDGDRQSYVVLVTDEDGHPVYSATLNYTGLWLLRD